MRRTALAVAAAALAACGIPKEKYDAAVTEGARARESYDAESKRAKDLEAKLADTAAGLKTCQEQAQAAAAEADRQRGKASELEQSKSQLEREAMRLEREKSELARKSAEYEALSRSLAGEIRAGRIQISELQGRMTIRLAEKVLFASGSATVNKDGRDALAKVADAFKGAKGRIIRVEGHTDDVPIKSARFPSNWELSSARAISVVRFLQDQGVDPTLLAAAGYAEFQPIAPNDTPEGRSQNRRIEISLAAAAAPAPGAAPAAAPAPPAK